MKDVKEIEVKAKIKNSKNLLSKLKEIGCVFSSPIIQEDKIFLQEGTKFEDVKTGTVVLRIRKENDKTILTLKKRQKVELSSIEKEIEVKDASILEEIIKHLGFYKISIVNKIRIKCKYKGYEICIDKVEGLGDFIEVEKMSKEDDEKKVQEEMFLFLESLGVKRQDRETSGYDVIAYYRNKT